MPSRRLFLLLLTSLAAPAFAAMPNCELKNPPPGAKRQATFGGEVLTYPPHVGTAYSGCQMAWMDDGELLTTTYYRDGKVISIKGRDPDDNKQFYCAYQDGALLREKSDANRCPEDVRQWPR